MAKKIIICGPAGVGKTTIRRIFFEGQNAEELLEHALEPTHGQESIILDLDEKVGVFDLAGQENERWLESEEKEIFENTKVILVVMDVNMGVNEIMDFLEKIINIRNELTPSSKIHIFVHKIDTIMTSECYKIEDELQEKIKDKKLISIDFTSINRDFMSQTLSSVINILKYTIQDERLSEKFDTEYLMIIIKLMFYVDQEISVSKKNLQAYLNLSQEELSELLEDLITKDYLKYGENKNRNILSLTDKGTEYFRVLSKSFEFNTKEITEGENYVKKMQKKNIPPFIGYFIANKDGMVLSTAEIEDGALHHYLGKEDEAGSEGHPFDIDLIPMFISALEKFSQEIHIKNFSGFNLMGSNLKMQIFDFGRFTVTVFSNPNINLKSIQYQIKNYFIELFKKYGEMLKKALKTGNVDEIAVLENVGKEWLKKMNESYEHMVINLELFDINHAKKLYEDLERIHQEIDQEISLTLDKIKNLKVRMMKAVISEDLESVKEIAKSAQDLRFSLSPN